MAPASKEASSTQAKIELRLKLVIELANHPFSDQPSTSVCRATNACHRIVRYQLIYETELDHRPTSS